MIKYFLLFLTTLNLQALVIKDCGEYKMTGSILKNQIETGYVFVVNKGTKSEYNFSIKSDDEIKISPYINRPILMHFIFDHLSGQNSNIKEIVSTKVVPVNFLDQSKSIELIKKMDCK